MYVCFYVYIWMYVFILLCVIYTYYVGCMLKPYRVPQTRILLFGGDWVHSLLFLLTSFSSKVVYATAREEVKSLWRIELPTLKYDGTCTQCTCTYGYHDVCVCVLYESLLVWINLCICRFGGAFTGWGQPFRLRHVVTGTSTPHATQ